MSQVTSGRFSLIPKLGQYASAGQPVHCNSEEMQRPDFLFGILQLYYEVKTWPCVCHQMEIRALSELDTCMVLLKYSEYMILNFLCKQQEETQTDVVF